MAQELMNPDYLSQSRFWFPEDTAPFGELNFIRIDHSFQPPSADSVSSVQRQVLTSAGPRLLRNAWRQSEWLSEGVGHEKSAAFMVGEDYETFQEKIKDDIIDATFFPYDKNAWFAVKPPDFREAKQREIVVRGLGWGIAPEQIVGFANAEHDFSGNVVQRAIKHLRSREKIYAAISNVAVETEHQNQKIGSTLLYLSLGMFGAEQRPTAHVATSNEHVLGELRSLGYQAVSSQTRTDLIPGVKIEEVRLRADSVKSVRERLLENYPWLSAAVESDRY